MLFDAGRFSHCCGPKHVEQSPYVRASFASASHAELRQGMERLGATLRAAQADRAVRDSSGSAESHASSGAAVRNVRDSMPVSVAPAPAAQPPAGSASAGLRGASFASVSQNGHAASAARKPPGVLHQDATENGHASGAASGRSMDAASDGAAERMSGLRLSQDAGKAARHIDPIPDGAAVTGPAPGGLGITADALAPRLAKTLDPKDSC